MESRKRKPKLTLPGAVLATAAAGFFLAGSPATASADAEPARVRCLGVNACKGKSECNTAHALKAQNACQGRGLLFLTEAQCEKRGGKIDLPDES